MNDVLLKLSNGDYRRLKWIADKLGLTISDCLRSLIPNIQPPESKVVQERDIRSAKFDDLVPIKKLSEKDREILRGYIDELIENKCAVTLAKEIKQQVLDTDGLHLTVSTCKRLGRWISPYRWTEREKYVKPRAQEISRILFGRDIPRFD
jgi:hypothetical protein